MLSNLIHLIFFLAFKKFPCFSNITQKCSRLLNSRVMFRSSRETIRLGSYCSGLSSKGAFHVYIAHTSMLLRCLPASTSHTSVHHYHTECIANWQPGQLDQWTDRPHKHGFNTDCHWFATTSELVMGPYQNPIRDRSHIFHVVKVAEASSLSFTPIKMRGDLSSCTTTALLRAVYRTNSVTAEI